MFTESRRLARTLWRAPAFTLPLLGLLALGLAAIWAGSDIVFVRLLRPLPYPDPARIVALREVAPNGERRPVSLAGLIAWRPRVQAFAAAAAYRVQSMTLALGPTAAGTVDSDIVEVGMATADFFGVLGVPPAPGRSFTEGEELRNEPVAIVSRRLATRLRTAGAVRLNDRLYTIVGTVRDDLFTIQGRVPDVYVPLDRDRYGRAHGLRTLEAIARLRPEADETAAAAQLTRAAALVAAERPETNRGWRATFTPLDDYLRGPQRRPVWLFALGAALLFVITAVNAMTLLLARAITRRAEVAVKLSLGATFGRLWRDALLEGLLLAAASLGLAALFARLLSSALLQMMPSLASDGVSGVAPTSFVAAWPAVAFVFAVALGLTVALALPSMLVVRAVRPTLRSTRTRGARVFTAQRLLVCGELAITLVLMLATGLLVRSFHHVLDVAPGFEPGDLVRFGIGLPEARYGTDDRQIAFHRRALDALADLPGVGGAAVVVRLPLSGPPLTTAMQLDADRRPRDERSSTAINVASSGYFALMGVPIVSGRDFTQDDDAKHPRVAVVNEAFRRRFTPGGSPVGRRLLLDWRSDAHPAGSAWEIVGVAGDMRQAALEQAPVPEVFLSAMQFPIDGGSYILRPSPSSDPLVTTAAVQAALERVDPRVQRVRVRPLATLFDASLGLRRRTLVLASIFAGLAILVAGTGLYGTVAFATTQRTGEFAIRMGLGAQPRDIAGLVFRAAITLAVAAIGPGMLLFYACARLLQHDLYGVARTDAPTWLAAAIGLVLLAVAASLGPARRAARVPIAMLLRAPD